MNLEKDLKQLKKEKQLKRICNCFNLEKEVKILLQDLEIEKNIIKKILDYKEYEKKR